MRNTFAEQLYKNAIVNKDIYVVVADISIAGNMIKFQKKYPHRFINVGVAEMSMIGMCAGLALEGKRSFAYTIANFTLYRPFEMVRNDLCYQNLPVTIVGMGAGTTYANLGGTHITQEDISIARSIPNMSIIAPADPLELKSAVDFCCMESNSPTYLRIGKSGEKNFTDQSKEKWKFGKIRKIINGKDLCILTYGNIINKAFGVSNKLEKLNKSCSIYSCSTLKPFDYKRLQKIFNKYKNIVVIEDHSVIGGLNSIVKVSAFENNYYGNIISFSLKDKFLNNYSSQDDLLNTHGISEEKIFKKIIKNLCP
jgi:transketolase